jgi:hypothetical protein
MTDKRKVFGTIKMLECTSCEVTLPVAAFEGEADTDTIGLCSAGKCNGLEVAIAEATPTEWSSLAAGSVSHLQDRIGAELGRDDLRVATVLRVEQGNEIPAGTSFAAFREAYRPPLLVYSCPCCGEGEAKEIEEFTVDAFIALGGGILSVGALEIETPK